MEEQYYYHCSTRCLPTTLYPRKTGEHRPFSESETPRICVGPSVPHCMIALGTLLLNGDKIHVYRTTKKVNAKPADETVHDADITHEHWRTTPTTFTHIYTIKPDASIRDVLSTLQAIGSRDGISRQTEALVKLQVLATQGRI